MRHSRNRIMNEAQSAISRAGVELLQGLPRQEMSVEQQLEAIRKIQSQAEQRVKLGMQLFKAAESRIAAQNDILDKVRQSQANIREKINEDVTRTLHSYDQWIGQIDESFTHALREMAERIDQLQVNSDSMQDKIDQLINRAEGLLEQCEDKLDIAASTASSLTSAQGPTSPDQQAGTPVADVEATADGEQSEVAPPAEQPEQPEPAEPTATDQSAEPAADQQADTPSASSQPDVSSPSQLEQEKVFSKALEQLRLDPIHEPKLDEDDPDQGSTASDRHAA